MADNVTRTASVVALEWTDLVYVTKDDFQGLISSFPREQFKIYKYGESKIKNWKFIKAREYEEQQKRHKEKQRKKLASTSLNKSASLEKDGIVDDGVLDPESPRKQSQSTGSAASATTTTPTSGTSTRACTSVDDDHRRYTNSVHAIRTNSFVDTGDIDLVDNTTEQKSKKSAKKRGGRNPARPRERSESVSQSGRVGWRQDKDDEKKQDGVESDVLQKWPDDQVLSRMRFLKEQMRKMEITWFAHLVKTNNMTQRADENEEEAVELIHKESASEKNDVSNVDVSIAADLSK